MSATGLPSHDTAHDAAASWHAMPAAQALAALGSDAATGLDTATAAARLLQHGPNALPEAPRRSAFGLFVRQFMSPLIGILLAAAVLAATLGHHTDALVILVVVLTNAVIGAVQEGRAERSMAALRELATLTVRVRRAQRELSIAAHDLVPGDVLLLAAGDSIAADARLLEAAQLQVAEAALTGESVPVAKSTAVLPGSAALADRHNMVYSGTHVTAGRASALVVATGRNTEVGRIAGLTAQGGEVKTPLAERIERFGRWLLWAALALFVAVLALGALRRLPLDDVLMVAISQMVSMVPEGLPVAMTIALAVGMQRMAARGAIVRRLGAVETLGSTSVICSDKTGTLTRNEMTASAVWLPGGTEIAVQGSGYLPHGALSASPPALLPLLHAAVLCNDAALLPPEDERAGWSVRGDPTEGALKVLARKAGLDLDALERAAPREAEWPFDADTKLMATRHRSADAPRRVFIKGAPEAVLRLCAADGAAVLHHARAAADAMAARALRVLAFATVDDDPLDEQAGFDALAGRARLLGLIGEIDPPRLEVKAAVASCRAAGVRPVMVTGDHKLTGLAIARSTARSSSAWASPSCSTRSTASPSSRACIRRRSCASCRRCRPTARWSR
ncbi:MAG TPA: HAD-IC family P-type ATPase [Burkholderiaceae bacterium]|nr:HAD-IC family P-type ATPase [Burkholderiaceae bacterium]